MALKFVVLNKSNNNKNFGNISNNNNVLDAIGTFYEICNKAYVVCSMYILLQRSNKQNR